MLSLAGIKDLLSFVGTKDFLGVVGIKDFPDFANLQHMILLSSCCKII